MNSRYMQNNSYVEDPDILYGAHYITLLSNKVSYENNVGKFLINYATPNMDGKAYNKKEAKVSTSNVVNKESKLGTTNVTSSNYIEIEVPKHLFYIMDLNINTNKTLCGHCGTAVGSCDPQIKITRKEYYKGQKFVIINAGGSIDKPCIIGVV